MKTQIIGIGIIYGAPPEERELENVNRICISAQLVMGPDGECTQLYQCTGCEFHTGALGDLLRHIDCRSRPLEKVFVRRR